MGFRTFLAIEASAEVRSRVGDLISELAQGRANVKWVDPDNAHVTLKFFGDVADEDVTRICTSVGETVAPLAPFTCECQGVGAFPHLKRPRTIWVGVQAGEEDMIQLYRQVDRGLRTLGFPKEHRRFHPHLTIGRVRGNRDAGQLSTSLGALAEIPLGTLRVSEVILFASELRPAGPIYTPLGRFQLTGA